MVELLHAHSVSMSIKPTSQISTHNYTKSVTFPSSIKTRREARCTTATSQMKTIHICLSSQDALMCVTEVLNYPCSQTHQYMTNDCSLSSHQGDNTSKNETHFSEIETILISLDVHSSFNTEDFDLDLCVL